MEKSILIDSICYEGLLFVEKIRYEKEIIYDISHNSKQLVPSSYLYPVEKIENVVYEHSKIDRIHSPIYFSQSEITELMTLQSAVTVFDNEANKIRSILKIPLADFSDKLETYYVPNLDKNDTYRLHRLELIGIKRIDRMLCSKRMNAIRFISLSELKKCQKHVVPQSNDYICQGRKVVLNHSFDSCESISNLPPAIAISLDESTFILDYPGGQVKIACKNEKDEYERKLVNISTEPLKIKIPLNCELKSEHFTISRSEAETDKLTSTETVEFHEIETRHTSIHELAMKKAGNQTIPEPKYIQEIVKDKNRLEEDVEQMQNDMNNLSDQNHYSFSIGSLLCASIALVTVLSLIIVWYCRMKYGLCKSNNKNRNNEIELTNFAEINVRTEIENIRVRMQNIDDRKIDLNQHERTIQNLENEISNLKDLIKGINEEVIKELANKTLKIPEKKQ